MVSSSRSASRRAASRSSSPGSTSDASQPDRRARCEPKQQVASGSVGARASMPAAITSSATRSRACGSGDAPEAAQADRAPRGCGQADGQRRENRQCRATSSSATIVPAALPVRRWVDTTSSPESNSWSCGWNRYRHDHRALRISMSPTNSSRRARRARRRAVRSSVVASARTSATTRLLVAAMPVEEAGQQPRRLLASGRSAVRGRPAVRPATRACTWPSSSAVGRRPVAAIGPVQAASGQSSDRLGTARPRASRGASTSRCSRRGCRRAIPSRIDWSPFLAATSRRRRR